MHPSAISRRRPFRPGLRRVGVALVGLVSLAVLVAPGGARRAQAASPPPSVVVIVADDMRPDMLWAMPNVRHLLADHGVTFTSAYVSNALCCPSRASMLTGAYAHTTGVYLNQTPAHGGTLLDDSSTLATWLDPAYDTALVGKYMNTYEDEAALGHEPQGWDTWRSFAKPDYYGYDLNEDGVLEHFGHQNHDYSTSVLTRDAVSFIDGSTGPLFLWYAPFAPHDPATPAPSDRHAFDGLAPYRPPSYNEPDVHDKPRWLRRWPQLSLVAQNELDRLRRHQYASLLGLDRGVGRLVDALSASGRLDDTAIVFISDNGQLWGEHRWRSKNIGYEEAVHVPLVIRYDPLTASLSPNERADAHLAVNIDIAPTIAELAGVAAPGAEGVSLVPLLQDGSPATWRSDFLTEHLGFDKPFVPTFCGVHTATTNYMRYADGEEELYLHGTDPYELHNVASRAADAPLLADMRTRLGALCNPPPPGFTLPGP